MLGAEGGVRKGEGEERIFFCAKGKRYATPFNTTFLFGLSVGAARTIYSNFQAICFHVGRFWFGGEEARRDIPSDIFLTGQWRQDPSSEVCIQYMRDKEGSKKEGPDVIVQCFLLFVWEVFWIFFFKPDV